MKIAVLSDIHDNLKNLEWTLKYLKEEKIDQVICCGDFCAPFTARFLAKVNLPIYGVFGNNDGDQGGLISTTNNQIYFKTLGEEHHELILDDKRIVFTHYPKYAKLLFETGVYDAVFYGHDHLKYLDFMDGKILCNPGPVCGIIKGSISQGTFAVYQTKENKVDFINIDHDFQL